MYQHFAYFLNYWYVYYFRDYDALKSTYYIHGPWINQQLPIDDLTFWFAKHFTPWVEQIYLALAAFNLANRPSNLLKQQWLSKLKIFLLIFLFFTMENFICSPNFGEAISFYPIMAWMIILALLISIFHFFGFRGIVIGAILSIFPLMLDQIDILEDLEIFLRYRFHPSFEIDARPEYFLTSGFLGFLLGYAYQHKWFSQAKQLAVGGCLGLLITIPYLFSGQSFPVNRQNVFATEHLLTESTKGMLYIWGMQIFFISLFLLLESKKIVFKNNFLNWVGINSLMIFAFHRIFFVHFYGPCRTALGSILAIPMQNYYWEIWIAIFFCVLMVYGIRRSKMLLIIYGKQP